MKIGKPKRKTGKIVAIIAVVAVVVCNGSYWVGSRVEKEFRETVEKASGQDITISVVDYRRSIFSATARTDIVFQVVNEDSSDTESVTVPVFHSIRHGPVLALGSAARIHSEVQQAQLTEDDLAQLSEIFDGDPFFPVLDAVVGWTGGLRFQLALPKTDKLHFRRMSESGAVRNIEFENVYASVAASISAKDGIVNKAEMKLGADKIITVGEIKEEVDDLHLILLFENIDIQVINNGVWQAIVDILGEQEQAVAPWLRRKPVFAIKEMHAHWPEGSATASFRIAYTGNTDIKPDTPFGNISGDLKMTMPRALAVRHLSTQVRDAITDSLEGDEEHEVDVEKETKEQVDKQMAAMFRDGIFVEKGDTLNVDAHLKDGVLNLNGETRPVELLLELIPPFL